VQVTRDGGTAWTNVRDKIPGHPGYWVSRVEPSTHDAAVAFVSVTGYRNDDFKPFVWKTSDYGQTWTSVAGNLPNEPINAIRQDRRNPNLLIAGTEGGSVYASLDGGKVWHDIRGNMPRQFVYDLAIHPRDGELVVATHGRGIFIADISHLQEMTPAVANAEAHLFDVRPTVQWTNVGLPRASSSNNFNGPSRPAGAVIKYWLKTAPAGDVRVRIYEGARLVRELPGTKNAGVNTVVWDLSRIVRERTEAEKKELQGRGAGRGGGGGRGGGQPAANLDHIVGPGAPGNYRVVLSVGGRETEKTLTVVPDPAAR
jgi:hypothetical protein